jgi:hypothetical protein
MRVNIDEKQINRPYLKRHRRREIKRALCPKNVSPGQANWALRVEKTILVVMK